MNNTNSRENVDALSQLSKEQDSEGFDAEAGQTWIYPTNYSLREYQYNIIEQSLYQNTLVSLPTGLGKTFIAAVVMYNFYRWYPTGKVIFMAPTRPLVKQQIDACYNIMAIPETVTAELTGSKQQAARKKIWNEKRVFFSTPQILQNDIEIIAGLSSKIKCLVFDEAHKAKGNHAYCEVIRKLRPMNKYFRILALSATPGSTLKDVHEVINNLLISHLEIRTEDSPDVAPYIFQRLIEIVVVPLDGLLKQVKDDYIKVLEKHTRVLISHRVITGNCGMLTKGKIFMTMKEYQERNKRDKAYNEIMRNLNICVTLYHAYELLIRHGLRGFLSFFEDHADKPLFRGIQDIFRIMEDIRNYLGPVPNVEPLPDGSVPEIPDTVKYGHPKYYKLRDILVGHFSDPVNADSRVIVFCEYKESVMEAYTLLLQAGGLIKPKYFMGQGAITQRQQINVIKSFRQGDCNTLISTCIGEEGLDVGEIDLIVCFDINNKSPIRLVQRMGRTGRKRQGKVVILVTEGREQQTLQECLLQKNNLSKSILTSNHLHGTLYKENPRMIPENLNPTCQKMYITVEKAKNTKSIKSNSKSRNIKEVINNMVVTSEDVQKTKSLEENNVLKISENQKGGTAGTVSQKSTEGRKKKGKSIKSNKGSNFKQGDIRSLILKGENKKILPKLTEDDEGVIEIVDTSPASSQNEVSTDKLFYEISTYITITKDYPCQICKYFFDCSKLSNHTKLNSTFDISNWMELDDTVFTEISTEALVSFADSLQSKQYEYYNELDVPECINFAPENPRLINEESNFDKNEPLINRGENFNIIMNASLEKTPENEIKIDKNKQKAWINEIGGSKNKETCLNVSFMPPKNLQQTLQKTDISLNQNDSVLENVCITQLEKTTEFKNKKNIETINEVKNITILPTHSLKISKISERRPVNLSILQGIAENKNDYSESCQDINSLSDFVDMEEIFTINKKNKMQNITSSNVKDVLQFFYLDSLADIFQPLEKDKDSLQKSGDLFDSSGDSNITVIYTPEKSKLHTGNEKMSPESDTSPILCTYDQRQALRMKTQRKLYCQKQTDNFFNNFMKTQKTQELNFLNTKEQSNEKVRDFLITTTETNVRNISKFPSHHSSSDFEPDMKKINKRESILENYKEKGVESNVSIYNSSNEFEADTKFRNHKKAENDQSLLDVDTNIERYVNVNNVENKSPNKAHNATESLNLEDFCDVSIFGLETLASMTNKIANSSNLTAKNSHKSDDQPVKQTDNCNFDITIDAFSSSQKENIDKNTSIHNQLNKTLASQVTITQAIDYVNKKKSKTVCSYLTKLEEVDYSGDSCFIESRSKSPAVTPTKREHIVKPCSRNSDRNFDKTPKSSKEKYKNSTARILERTLLDFADDDDFEKSLTKRNKLNIKDCNNSLQVTVASSTSGWIQTKNKSDRMQQTKSKQTSSTLNDLTNASLNWTQTKSKTTASVVDKPLNKDKKRLDCLQSIGKSQNKVNNKIVKINKRKKKHKTEDCEYIDLEANLDSGEEVSSDTSEDSEDDVFETSFVDDDTQDLLNNTEMHGHYLKSVRSPALKRGQFKIPKGPPKVLDVFSQGAKEEESMYLNDSFCDDNVFFESPTNEMSALELAEMKLEQEKRKNKRRKDSKGDDNKKVKAKRRKIIYISSDESD